MKIALVLFILTSTVAAWADDPSLPMPKQSREVVIRATEAFDPSQIESVMSDPFGVKFSLKGGAQVTAKYKDTPATSGAIHESSFERAPATPNKVRAQAYSERPNALPPTCNCQLSATPSAKFKTEFRHDLNDLGDEASEIKDKLTRFKVSSDGHQMIIVDPHGVKNWHVDFVHKIQ